MEIIMARFRNSLQVYPPCFAFCFLWANQECSYLPDTCLPVIFVPRALNNCKHGPLKQHVHRFEHHTNPNEGMEERLGGQVVAPWGRAARIRSPPQPQPDRSTACCVLLMHSTASSLRNRHTTWSKCTCARACLQSQKLWLLNGGKD